MKEIHIQLYNHNLHKIIFIQQSVLYTSTPASTKHNNKNVIIAPVDSAASCSYFPMLYNGEDHNDTGIPLKNQWYNNEISNVRSIHPGQNTR